MSETRPHEALETVVERLAAKTRNGPQRMTPEQTARWWLREIAEELDHTVFHYQADTPFYALGHIDGVNAVIKRLRTEADR